MRPYKVLTSALVLVLLIAAGSGVAMSGGPYTRQIAPSGATAFVQPGLEGGEGLQWPELGGAGSGEPGLPPYPGAIVNRSYSTPGAHGVSAQSGKKAKSNPELVLSFDGLNHRDQRLANGGNQFSVEPPDQGLCAGNGFVLESVNDVLRAYDTSGNALIGVVDLNTFYGYPAAIDRSKPPGDPRFGPSITDPSCHYDPDTQRWFHVVLTLDVNPVTGDFLGPNHLDIAVSQTADPTGAWTIFRLPVQNDGTDGTPDHGCSLHPDGSGHGPCLGDYPHVGADAYGFYITTNEYSFFGPEYKSANIYAFSKRALAAGGPVTAVQFDTPTAAAGNPGFTVWPAISPAGQYRMDTGGTEFFLSSDAAAEAKGTGSSNRLFLWRLTNTSSLDTATPAPALSNVAIPVGTYAIPPKADQKPGDFPLGQCINDTTPSGAECWRSLLFTSEPAHDEVISHLDSNDTRMQQVVYANGKVWSALDTAVTVNGVNKAGIEWFIINPGSAKVMKQGYLALADNNLTYPAIGVTASGRGVMAFTLVGANHYPSAGYASIDAVYGVGDIHVAAEGLGPSDGFTSYKAFVGDPPRTRWGDYGAAAMDGNTIWIASEYIGQTCTLAEYEASPFGSCGGTRTALGNWATRISQLNLQGP